MATPLIYDDTVYFGSLDRNLYAMNAADGRMKWHVTGENWFWAEPVIVITTFMPAVSTATFMSLRPIPGQRWPRLDLKGPVASRPVIVDNSVIFATRKGVIYSVNTSTNQATQLADIKLEVDGPLTASEGIVYIQTQDSLYSVSMRQRRRIITDLFEKPELR